MTLELIPTALGSKVMGSIVLTEGREGISLAQEQSSHHSPFMIRSWWWMPDPWFRITTQSPEDNHISQSLLKFLFSTALNSILSLMHQMHQGLSASFLFMPCHSIPNSTNNLKSYVMYHLSQSHITYNRYIARLPDYPPVSFPGITKCLVKVRACPIPLPGSRPQ